MKTVKIGIIFSALALAGLTSIAVSAPEATKTYTNPIIPGDWSDPGIVRVGEDYYTVRSSFGWQPGLHIAHSKDLIHWKYIGFADTKNAFDRKHGITEPGIWGSDIGYNPNNKTYLVYAPMGGHIRVFSSKHPAGPYKDGGKLTRGYDPGFFADDDGTLYLTKSGGEVHKLTPDGLRVDGDPIVKVAGGEGPELFKANGYYYYIISPGGTRPYQDHMIMSYRSKNLKGPWEKDPKNPVMHAPHTTNAKLQGPGHGEVFQTQNGEWFLSYHAYELSHYSLGRQTCLEPVTWTDDGWWRPVNGKIPSESNKAPDLKQVEFKMQDSDEFDTKDLGKQWFFHSESDVSGRSWSLTERPGFLRIKTAEGDISSLPVSKNLFLQRVMDKKFDVISEVEFDAKEGNEAAGIHFYHDPEKSFWLTTTVVEGKKMFEVGFYDKVFKSDVDPATLKPHQINKTYRSTPKEKKILARVPNTIGKKVFFKISVDGQETAHFFYGADGKNWTEIDAEIYFGDSWHCSRLGKKPGSPDLGWVGTGRDNVWTATVMGVFACKNGAAKSKNADFQSFQVIKH
ncbi:MAG: family 43 glycosylhydrolase [Verrucomicrobiae bacterium]|nr:family 43 glycosylhydrolase [Verrucomicrobiae bacterium]NNJ43614.1 family 43 glycosylhydrolase [Akkermansiaceae bacterium]